MKKILLLGLIVGFGLSACAADFAGGSMPGFGNAYSDITGLQNPNSELKLLEQQRFRKEEYNEFQDMKQVKEKRNKKIELEQQMKQVDQNRPTYGGTQGINLYRENGRLILKQID